MRIRIRGENEILTRREARYAVNWFLTDLIGPELTRGINLSLSFRPHLRGRIRKKTRDGKVKWKSAEFRGDVASYTSKQFVMRIVATESYKSQIESIAHECKHIEQYATGKLFDYASGRHIRWKKQVIVDWEDMEYESLPWEQDAYSCDKKLANRYIAHLKEVMLEFT